jgi:biotin transport system substrate-specific component
LQNLFSLLAGLILGPFLGGAAVLVYLAAGALGAPVFAGAAGGAFTFLRPSGGFLWGYFLAAVISGLIAGRPKTPPVNEYRFPAIVRIIIASLAGMASVYVPGLLWLKKAAGGSWMETLSWGLIPFIIGDAIKLVIAVLISPRIRRTSGRVLRSADISKGSERV